MNSRKTVILRVAGRLRKAAENESKDTKKLIISVQLGGWMLIVGAEVKNRKRASFSLSSNAMQQLNNELKRISLAFDALHTALVATTNLHCCFLCTLQPSLPHSLIQIQIPKPYISNTNLLCCFLLSFFLLLLV